MKKFLALLLAMVMVLGLFAGCGNQKKKSSSKKSSSKKDDKSSSATGNTDGTGGTGSTGTAADTETTGATYGPGYNDDGDYEYTYPTEDDDYEYTYPTEDDDFEITEPSGGVVRPYPGGTSDVAVGTVLAQPEKIFDKESTESIFLSINATENGESFTIQLAVKSYSDTSGVVYFANPRADTDVAVYEVNGNTVVKYAKNASDYAFYRDTTADAADELDDIFDFLEIFVACQEAYSNIQFRKSNAVTNHTTGPVYAYDVIFNGRVDGQILINRETGLLVKVRGYSEYFSYDVTRFMFAGFNIPAYK